MDAVGSAAPGPELGDLTGLVRRQWWLLVLLPLLGVMVAALYTSGQPRIYTSATEVLVTATGVDDNSVLANGRTRGEINLDTEAQLITSTSVAQSAAELLGGEETAAELVKRVRITVPPNTEVIAISFTAATPVQAQVGARSFAQAYLANRAETAEAELSARRGSRELLLTSLTTTLRELTGSLVTLPADSAERAIAQAQADSLGAQIVLLNAELTELESTPVTPGRTITEASLPTAPSSPLLPLNLAGGAMVGLLAGCGLAVLRHRSGRYLREASDLPGQTGLPVLASIAARGAAWSVLPAGDGDAAYGYVRLRNAITATIEPDQQVVLVAGVSREIGGVAANLAAALARAGSEVVLLSADPRSTTVSRLTLASKSAGLSEVLADDVPAGSALQRATEPRTLQVLGPGLDPQRAATLLQTSAAGQLVDHLRTTARFVIVEAPPTTTSGQAQTLATLADLVIVVVQSGQTRTADLIDAAAQFTEMRTPLLGAVLVQGRRPAFLHRQRAPRRSAQPTGEAVEEVVPARPGNTSKAVIEVRAGDSSPRAPRRSGQDAVSRSAK